MTRRLVSGLAVGLLAAGIVGCTSQPMMPQPKADPKGYVAGTAYCDPKGNCGYWTDGWNTPGNNVVRSGAYNGALGLAGNVIFRHRTKGAGIIDDAEIHHRDAAR